MNMKLVAAVAFFFLKKSTLWSKIDLSYTFKVPSFTSDNIVYSHDTVASVER